jgi:uncharacterized FlgJ-related protein
MNLQRFMFERTCLINSIEKKSAETEEFSKISSNSKKKTFKNTLIKNITPMKKNIIRRVF